MHRETDLYVLWKICWHCSYFSLNLRLHQLIAENANPSHTVFDHHSEMHFCSHSLPAWTHHRYFMDVTLAVENTVIGFLHGMPWDRTSVLIDVTLDSNPKNWNFTNITAVLMDWVKTIQWLTTEHMLFQYMHRQQGCWTFSIELRMHFQVQYNFWI